MTQGNYSLIVSHNQIITLTKEKIMADIVDVLQKISAMDKERKAEAKRKWLDKIAVLEEVAVLFEDHKDPLTAMELRRSAQNLKSLSIINNR